MIEGIGDEGDGFALVLQDIDVFDTLDAADAEELAKAVGGTVYSWKTIGKHNWLEKGYSRGRHLGPCSAAG